MSRLPHLAFHIVAIAASVVVACGGSDDTDATSQTTHPALECGGESSGIGNYDVGGPGFATADAALDDRLSYCEGLYGGEVVRLSDNEAALQVAGSNVVVATASAAPEGGLLVQEDYFCDSFQPQQNGPPDTAPPVTAD